MYIIYCDMCKINKIFFLFNCLVVNSIQNKKTKKNKEIKKEKKNPNIKKNFSFNISNVEYDQQQIKKHVQDWCYKFLDGFTNLQFTCFQELFADKIQIPNEQKDLFKQQVIKSMGMGGQNNCYKLFGLEDENKLKILFFIFCFLKIILPNPEIIKTLDAFAKKGLLKMKEINLSKLQSLVDNQNPSEDMFNIQNNMQNDPNFEEFKKIMINFRDYFFDLILKEIVKFQIQLVNSFLIIDNEKIFFSDLLKDENFKKTLKEDLINILNYYIFIKNSDEKKTNE